MGEIAELLLEFAFERPIIGIAALILGLSFVSLVFLGSVVPMLSGLLIAFLVRWEISQRQVTTLKLCHDP